MSKRLEPLSSLQDNAVTLISLWLTSARNAKWNIHTERERRMRGIGQISNFQPISWRISETAQDYEQYYYDGLIGSCICALHWYKNHRPLDDLDTHYITEKTRLLENMQKKINPYYPDQNVGSSFWKYNTVFGYSGFSRTGHQTTVG